MADPPLYRTITGPAPPKEPIRLFNMLEHYACALFDLEAAKYPHGSQLPAWLACLVERIAAVVLDNLDQMERTSLLNFPPTKFSYHATTDEMRHAVREALERRSASRLRESRDGDVAFSDEPQPTQQTKDEAIPTDSEISPNTRSEVEPGTQPRLPETVAVQRALLLTTFKAKGRAARIKITDEMVAKAASPGKWNDRTMVTWWKRNDPPVQERS